MESRPLIEVTHDLMQDMLGWITISRWLWSKLQRKRAGGTSQSVSRRTLSIEEVGDRRIHEMVMESLRAPPFGQHADQGDGGGPVPGPSDALEVQGATA